MRKFPWCLLLVAASLIAAPESIIAQGTATYRVTFNATWSAQTHPDNFPPNPHFSGLIGGTHNSSVSFWEPGQLASLGIKNMAELGTKSALRSEVNQAITNGHANSVIDGGGIGTSPGTRTINITMDPYWPLVTVTSMLAPSPDWFVGTRGLSLLEDGYWVDTLEVEAFVYDAGTDSGDSYTAANNPTNPPENIARMESGPFLVGGTVTPVGTFRFELIRVEIPNAGYFSTDGIQILDPAGSPALIKGMGLGGWFVPEGYMFHIATQGRPDGPTAIREQMVELIGEDNTKEFYRLFRENFVNEKDIALIKQWGFDHVRLPFHYRDYYDPDTDSFREEGFDFLDTFLDWCRTHQVNVILDMHAAPGAQSDGGIADSDGEARLWTERETYWPQAIKIWREIARRYATEKLIIGYDFINEPVTPDSDPNVESADLRTLYEQIIAAVRPIDPNHLFFIEGNYFATTFGDLEPHLGDKTVYTFHKYWNGIGQNSIQYLLDLRARQNIPLWLGETGENSNPWFHEVTKLMESHQIGVNWWTHKKLETTTSPLSAPFAPGYEHVISYWRGQGPKPTREYARDALFAQARSLHVDSCRVNRGLLESLFNPNFGTARIPLKAHTIPGVISAADYDIGNQGVTYNDTDVWATTGAAGGGNTGTKYRNDGVDIEVSRDTSGVGYSVGWTKRLEWMTYTVDVSADDTYDFLVRVSAEDGGKYRFLMNDQPLHAGDIEVSPTGGWQVWETSTVPGVALTQGTHILKLLMTDGSINFSAMHIQKSDPTSVEHPEEIYGDPVLEGVYPNPFSSETQIDFSSPLPASALVAMYDVLGRRVYDSGPKEVSAGKNILKIAPAVAPGVYMVRLTVQGDGVRMKQFTRSVVVTR